MGPVRHRPSSSECRRTSYVRLGPRLVETRQGVGAFALRTEPVTRQVDVLAELRGARSALNRAITALEKAEDAR
ncbi:hypothetical protein [Kribbella sp. NPDC050459]|uniref:hypothetical protein n=1 Tax=Kribbella sp. NPDC050459 TaxID=3155785 RepID=UPI0033DE23C4